MHKVFISYHHKENQWAKEKLLNKYGDGDNQIFIDRSVNTGDINDDLSDEAIRKKIRDEYLRDTTVLIVLAGLQTKKRMHIDWEIYSSMYNGEVNKRCGILVITLPNTGNELSIVSHGDEEKTVVHPNVDQDSWCPLGDREEEKRRYPFMPSRILDNLPKKEAKISVVPWKKINLESLSFLVERVHEDRKKCEYDMSEPLKRCNG